MRLYVLLTLCVLVPSSVVASSSAAGARVRTVDPRVLAAIADGRARSESFRNVFDLVEQRDVIVYVEVDPQLRGRLSGAMTWVAATKHYRYVRVALNPELTGSRLVAALAHELQHVVEIGAAPDVIDSRTLSTYYRSIGDQKRAHSEEWDTEAARVMGDVVRRELASAADSVEGAAVVAPALARANTGWR